MCEVDIEHVSFVYNTITVLDNITIKVLPGDFVVVVGPNGAGKSTLLRLVAGLLKPCQGTIRIGGQPVSQASKQALIGYVPQNYGRNTAGFPATVEEIVALGLIGSRMKSNTSGVKHIVSHMLELVGMSDYRRSRIGDLSGGQQQRVMVARALAGNPQLLLLDEPTSGIDYEASSRIFELLGHLHANLGITVVMVSHDIDRSVIHATKVACINRGLCYFGGTDDFRQDHVASSHLWYYAG